MNVEPAWIAVAASIGTTVIATTVACVAFAITVKSHVKLVEVKMDLTNERLDKIEKVVSIQIRHDERIGRLEEDMRELKHGEGMVLPLSPRKSAFGGEG